MKQIWAPWRLEYVLSDKEENGCIFCTKPKEDKDGENLILYRGKYNFIILNRYPYNNGHLMVVPYSHTSDIENLSKDEMDENGYLVQRSVSALKEKFQPQGFNIGINIGSVGGAGMAEHIHMHIVPRWGGDTNFMPVIGETHVMPQHIETTYQSLAPVFAKIEQK